MTDKKAKTYRQSGPTCVGKRALLWSKEPDYDQKSPWAKEHYYDQKSPTMSSLQASLNLKEIAEQQICDLNWTHYIRYIRYTHRQSKPRRGTLLRQSVFSTCSGGGARIGLSCFNASMLQHKLIRTRRRIKPTQKKRCQECNDLEPKPETLNLAGNGDYSRIPSSM